jgi:hypothetical protein
VIDITHAIPAHDVRAGALTLWRAVPWLVPGVILAVVDPGVGTARRAVAIEVAEAGAVLVGPDNGLLLPAATRLGTVSAAVELTGPMSEGPGSTFAGRDILAPAAARAARGEPVGELGTAVDPATLAGEPVPQPTWTPGPPPRLQAEVLWVDRFGNAQLNVEWPGGLAPAAEAGAQVEVQTATGRMTVRTVFAYGELEAGEVGLVVDSYRMLSLALNGASAADHLALRSGQAVWLAVNDLGHR